MDTTKNYGNSSFWMDRFDTSSTSYASDLEKSNNGLYKLAAQKRAISNFVSIVTNQRIPVQFASTGDSYTDGKSVVISSRLNKEAEFDVAVGLALHEGSHIKLSDFELLERLSTEIYNLDDYSEFSDICSLGGVSPLYTIKDILNWVEDRRIDNYIYSSSPGYRAYYQALYDKYFNDELIDKALQSSEMTDETFDSYMFRLINLHSKFSRLNALKGLKSIWRIADLKNIDRLQTTKDAFNVAVDIFRVICENVGAEQKAKEAENAKQQEQGNSNSQNQSSSGNGDGGEPQTETNPQSSNELSDEDFEKMLDSLGLGDDDGKKDENDTNSKSSGGKSEASDNEVDEAKSDTNSKSSGGKSEAGADEAATSNTQKIAVDNLPDNIGDMNAGSGDGDVLDEEDDIPTVSLTDRQKDILGKKIKKQKEFIRGEISKTKLSKSEAKSVDVIEASGAEFVEVGGTYEASSTYKKTPTINCILVKNMTRDLMETEDFPLTRKSYSYSEKGYTLHQRSAEAVDKGIRLGTILGKKMQVRAESRDTIFNRQLTGKLDKRMVASLGYGNTQAFYTKETDMFNKVNLHISVDASSSMSGGGIWENTMTNVVALAKAVDMISNLELQISFRTTNRGSATSEPYIVIAYDSRKDKFTKIKQLFPYLNPNGTTPEGLCFEAIQKYMVATSNGLDSYFLNISDGEPYYMGGGLYYSGYPAAVHIKKMMDGYRKMGIGVLSYFVSAIKVSGAQSKIFTESYGKSAKFIDVTSVNEVSKTMNELFMKK
jgi:hypothetical protein